MASEGHYNSSKPSPPFLILKETPEEEHHLKELANNGINVVIPLSKLLLNPVDKAWAMVSLDELAEGQDKQLLTGRRLVISVSPNEPRDRLLKLKKLDNVEFIFLDEPSMTPFPTISTSQCAGLEAFLKENGIDLNVISRINLPPINLRDLTVGGRKGRQANPEIIKYIDFPLSYALNKNFIKHIDRRIHIMDDHEVTERDESSSSNAPRMGRIYHF